jgi:beta-catenin-like protein 1
MAKHICMRKVSYLLAVCFSRFIDSEADLDDAIRALLPLAQVPVLAFPEMVRSGAVARLVGLLSHENADIAIDVVEVIHELTDEDNEADEEEEDEDARDAAVKTIINSFVCLPLRPIMDLD